MVKRFWSYSWDLPHHCRLRILLNHQSRKSMPNRPLQGRNSGTPRIAPNDAPFHKGRNTPSAYPN